MSIFSKKTKPLSRLKMFKIQTKLKRATASLKRGQMGATYDIGMYAKKAFDYAHDINAGHVKIPYTRLNATIRFLKKTSVHGRREDYLKEPDSIRAIRILEKCYRERISVKESAQKIAEAELLIKNINEGTSNIRPEKLPAKNNTKPAFPEPQIIQNEMDEQPVNVPEQHAEVAQPKIVPTTENNNNQDKPVKDETLWRTLVKHSPTYVSDVLYSVSDVLYSLTFGPKQKLNAIKEKFLRKPKEKVKKQPTSAKTVTLSPKTDIPQSDSKISFRWQYAASFALIVCACGFFGNSSSTKNSNDNPAQTNASLAQNHGVTYTIPYNFNQQQPVVQVLDAYRNATPETNDEPRIKISVVEKSDNSKPAKSVKKVVKDKKTVKTDTGASDKFYDSRLDMFLGKKNKEILVNKIQQQINDGNININKSITATQIAYAKCIYNKYGYKIDVLESAAKGQKLTSDQNNELANVVLLVGDRGIGVQKLAQSHCTSRDIHEMCAPKETQNKTAQTTTQKQTSEPVKETVSVDTAYANAMRNYYDSKLDIIAGRKKDAVLSATRKINLTTEISNSITPERLAYVYFLYCEYGLKNAVLESAIKDNRRLEPDEIAELTKIILTDGENGTGVRDIAKASLEKRGINQMSNQSKFDNATRAQKLRFLATKYNWKHR